MRLFSKYQAKIDRAKALTKQRTIIREIKNTRIAFLEFGYLIPKDRLPSLLLDLVDNHPNIDAETVRRMATILDRHADKLEGHGKVHVLRQSGL